MQVYILCGAGVKSGGPELAHQLCYEINMRSDIAAKMCYVDTGAQIEKCLPIDCTCPEPYSIYLTECANNLEEMDCSDNIVIIPEGLTLSHILFKKARIMIWWMSVDNYFVSTSGKNIEELNRHAVMHLTQSYYAYMFCMDHFNADKIRMLSDYINPAHGTFLYPAEYRTDSVLYNPAKGYDRIKPFLDDYGWIKWIPIVGLSLEGTIVLMQNSKIYIDFGEHPGKDRMPREAALNGCCVITNRLGSAFYREDVPIPDEYKFSDPLLQKDEIIGLIRDVFDDFPKHQHRFDDYRRWIKDEKNRFEQEVDSLIKCFNNLVC